jgi:glycerophosphoryl diester phosphodiesterase
MKFIAHRGYSLRFPENSLPAFSAVVEHPQNGRSLLGFEFDVHLTADGKMVIMHETVVRGGDGGPVAVGAITFDELQRYHRKARPGWFPPVAELGEVLAVAAHRTELYIEIKAGAYDLGRFMGLFMDALEGYGPAGDVVLSSFSGDILGAVTGATRHLDVKYAFCFETWEQWEGLAGDVYERMHYIHPDYRLIAAKPETIPALGRPVQCWAVNDPEVVQQLLDLPQAPHIRSIFTDDIELANRFPEP